MLLKTLREEVLEANPMLVRRSLFPHAFGPRSLAADDPNAVPREYSTPGPRITSDPASEIPTPLGSCKDVSRVPCPHLTVGIDAFYGQVNIE
jgi:hypothetical protein